MNLKIRPNRIKEWISKRALNQSEIARQLGISTSYLSLITNGKRNPNLRLSTKLANLLDADLLDLFPQFGDTQIPDNVLDLVFCSSGQAEHEGLLNSLRKKNLHFVVANGDFEAGYSVALNRPFVLLIDVENMRRSLSALVGSLKSEPTTRHTEVVPLIGTDAGKRRRRQIDKMGLDLCEWGGGSPDQIAEKISEIIKKVKAKTG